MTTIELLEQEQHRIRREVLTHTVLSTLQRTIQLRGIKSNTPVDEVRADFTDASARIVAQLIDAVDILEAIIYASDQCAGHRQCRHSMEPWQRARALLKGKWDAYERCTTWPSPYYDSSKPKS